MFLRRLWTTLCMSSIVCGLPVNDVSFRADSDRPLILSPLTAAGRIKEAQRLSAVVDAEFKVSSHAGFLTVNETCGSNMFFWLFPSQNNASADPVSVWLNGGPGSSSLLGLFRENGPYRLTANENIAFNPFSWTRNSSVLYVDNPVGTGFSFAESVDCYCKDEFQVATNFLSFLDEFFLLFPKLKSNRFYLTGESYAGKYIPAIAYAIFTRKTNIRLDGIAIGNGLIDPYNQLHYAKHFYYLGLVDEKIEREMEKAEEEARALIKSGDFSGAATKRVDMIKEIFGKNNGYTDFYNYLFPDRVVKGSLRKFFERKSVRSAIHVGNQPFANSTLVSTILFNDLMRSVRPWLEFLVDKCRVCLYYGQMDLRDSYVASTDFISNLKWSGTSSFKMAPRKVWRVGKDLAGYVKTFGNLTEVMVRNAGHFVPTDQPKWALDMYNRFIFNQSF